MAVISLYHPISLKQSDHLLLNNNNNVFSSSFPRNISFCSLRLGFSGRISISYKRITAFSGGGSIPPGGNNSDGSGCNNSDGSGGDGGDENGGKSSKWVFSKVPKDDPVKSYGRPVTLASEFEDYSNKLIFFGVCSLLFPHVLAILPNPNDRRKIRSDVGKTKESNNDDSVA